MLHLLSVFYRWGGITSYSWTWPSLCNSAINFISYSPFNWSNKSFSSSSYNLDIWFCKDFSISCHISFRSLQSTQNIPFCSYFKKFCTCLLLWQEHSETAENCMTNYRRIQNSLLLYTSLLGGCASPINFILDKSSLLLPWNSNQVAIVYLGTGTHLYEVQIYICRYTFIPWVGLRTLP